MPHVGEISKPATAIFLAAYLPLLLLSFYNNSSCLLIGVDGAQWVTMMNAQAEFRMPFSQVGVDPFQGSFDAYYPTFREYLLPNLLTMPFSDGNASSTMTYFVYSALMAFSTYAVGRATGMTRGVALVGGSLVPLLVLPMRPGHEAFLYSIYSLNPHFAQVASLALLIVAALWALDGRRPLAAAGLVLASVICLLLAFLSLVPYLVLMALPIAIYGVGSLLAAANWRGNISRVLAGLLMIAIPTALGMVTYAYGLNSYGVYAFFPHELELRPGGNEGLHFASNIYHPGWTAKILLGLGVIGALGAACYGGRKLRRFGSIYLVSTALFHLVAYTLVVHVPLSRIGPAPLYFELMLQPFSILFAVLPLFFGANALAKSVARFRQVQHSSDQGHIASIIAKVALCATPCYLLAVNANAAVHAWPISCSGRSFSPIQPTPITKRLAEEIAVRQNAPFRGLVATIAGTGDKPSVTWIDLHSYDIFMWQAVGNDHRTVGLWRYDIPTLFHYSVYATPPYYLLLTDFLARPEDQQVRSVQVLTRPNVGMLKLWGSRFVITDIDEGIGKTVLEMPIPGQKGLRLVELEDANLGNYSPTAVHHINDFREGLAWMHDARFDGRHTMVTDNPLEGPYVEAQDVQLSYEPDGFALRAASAGRSLLVLPIQYSRCWTISTPKQASLFRANLMQLGVSFSGKLDARLVFRYGPVLAGDCRIADLRDAHRLRVGEARDRARRGEGK